MTLANGMLFLFFMLFPLLYFLAPLSWRKWFLLGGSLLFYAIFCGGSGLVFLLLLTGMTWGIGWRIAVLRAREKEELEQRRSDGSWSKDQRNEYHRREQCRQRIVLTVGILGALLLLVSFRYIFPRLLPGEILTVTGFGAWTVPLGISFTVLSSIGYMTDVFRGEVEGHGGVWQVALFLFYFPQMIQGPIHRYRELMPELCAGRPFCPERAVAGILRMLWGYWKKLVVADTVGVAVLAIREHSGDFTGWALLIPVLLYSIQIYGDFTGGMDVVLGFSEILGIGMTENFNHPFSSPSVKLYWRRWHISMGRWFTDYVFYPLSASLLMQKLSRGVRKHLGDAAARKIPLWVAMTVTWLMTGLWHGLSWNFVVWGLCNGVWIMVSQEAEPLRLRLRTQFFDKIPESVRHMVCCTGTFLVVGIFRLLDIFPDVGATFRLWGSFLLRPWKIGPVFSCDGEGWLHLTVAEWMLVAAGVVLMACVSGRNRESAAKPLRYRLAARPYLSAVLTATMVVMILVFGRYGIGYDPMDFIYGQF